MFLLIDGHIYGNGLEPDITPKTRRAIERALEFLMKRQNSDGSFGNMYSLASSSLAGLAFLAYGNLYNEGLYGSCVAKLVDYILKTQDSVGFFDDNQCMMHGHGYATLFLAEVYGSLPPTLQAKVKEALRKAIKVIERSQSNYGGWYYYPSHTAGFVPSDEGSVTVTQVQALRSARNSGIYISKKVIDNGIKYIQKCMTPQGCRYTLSGGGCTYTLTAAAVSVLNAYGVHESKEANIGMNVLRNAIKGRGNAFEVAEYTWYGNLYAAQSFYQAGDKDWAAYYKGTYKYLISTQGQSGGWSGDYGDVFATAIAALILELPLCYLPLFQR
jgi:squalene cyclase